MERDTGNRLRGLVPDSNIRTSTSQSEVKPASLRLRSMGTVRPVKPVQPGQETVRTITHQPADAPKVVVAEPVKNPERVDTPKRIATEISPVTAPEHSQVPQRVSPRLDVSRLSGASASSGTPRRTTWSPGINLSRRSIVFGGGAALVLLGAFGTGTLFGESRITQHYDGKPGDPLWHDPNGAKRGYDFVQVPHFVPVEGQFLNVPVALESQTDPSKKIEATSTPILTSPGIDPANLTDKKLDPKKTYLFGYTIGDGFTARATIETTEGTTKSYQDEPQIVKADQLLKRHIYLKFIDEKGNAVDPVTGEPDPKGEEYFMPFTPNINLKALDGSEYQRKLILEKK